jgi:hypothetical protein
VINGWLLRATARLISSHKNSDASYQKELSFRWLCFFVVFMTVRTNKCRTKELPFLNDFEEFQVLKAFFGLEKTFFEKFFSLKHAAPFLVLTRSRVQLLNLILSFCHVHNSPAILP